MTWAPFPIPQRQPAQLHLSHGEDQWLGDSLKAPKSAGRKGKRGGSDCTDTNVNPLLNGAGVIHKRKARGTGWRYLAIGGGRRRLLTEEELDTPYDQWPKEKFVRQRRTKRAWFSFESRVRPLLYAESLAAHKKYGATPVIDLKGQFTPEAARTMWEVAARMRQAVWFKTIVFQAIEAPRPSYSMAVAGRKAAPFHAAGAPVALATHGYPKPSDLDEWRKHYDAVWGRWA